MNESNLKQLKIIVERAVRPVRSSTGRKHKMREELLAHVSGVFEEELARLGDDRTALERTALRFGNPAQVTRELQESVPARDGIVRFFEGRPDESIFKGALRFAWIEATIAWLALGAAFLAVSWQSAWSPEELKTVVLSFGFLPFWLLMPVWLLDIAFVARWLEPSLRGRDPLTGWPRVGLKKLLRSAWAVPAVKWALISGGASAAALACIGGFRWPLQPAGWYPWTSLAGLLFAVPVTTSMVIVAWGLVQTLEARRRRHQEWADLPLASAE
jgi:hypothetical protein